MQAAVDTAAGLGPLRIVVNCAGIATPGKVLGRDGVLPLEAFNRVIQVNLIGTFNVAAAGRRGDGGHRAGRHRAGRPGARRHHQHRLRGRLRRPDRPARLRRLQGCCGGHDAAARPGAGTLAGPRGHHCPRHLRNAHDGRAAAGGAGFPRGAGSAPFPAGQARRVRQAGGPHRGQRHAQRRNHPPGRRHPDGHRSERGPCPPNCPRQTSSPSNPCSAGPSRPSWPNFGISWPRRSPRTRGTGGTRRNSRRISCPSSPRWS